MATVISKIGDKRFEWTFEEDGSISLGGKGVHADVTENLCRKIFNTPGGQIVSCCYR